MVEYLLAGRPVIASYSGYPSMLNEARAGVFVEAGDEAALLDQVIAFAEMPTAAREEMGQRGREWILANRSYRSLALRYLQAIDSTRLTRHDGDYGADARF